MLEQALNTIHKTATIAWEMTDPAPDIEIVNTTVVLPGHNFYRDKCWIHNMTCQEGYCKDCQIYIKWRNELNEEGLI